MKHLSTLAFVAFFILLSSSTAMGQVVFKTGNDLVEGKQAYKKTNHNAGDGVIEALYMGYITGVHDATYFFYGVSEDVPLSQLISVVGKYLDDHPERWREPASRLVIDALTTAFPKKQK